MRRSEPIKCRRIVGNSSQLVRNIARLAWICQRNFLKKPPQMPEKRDWHGKIHWMNFSEFTALCYELEKTSSRLAKVAAAAEYLKRLEPNEIRDGVAFLSGRPFPISDPRTLDIGSSAFSHALKTPPIENAVAPSLTLKMLPTTLRRLLKPKERDREQLSMLA